MTVLSSQWGNLSPHLLATLREVHLPKSGDWTRPETDYSLAVVAPFSEGTLEQVHNWTSPFEGRTLDSEGGMHTFSAAMQTGIGAKIANDLGKLATSEATSAIFKSLGESAGSVAGRTGVTKLNSTQVYSGSPPLKLTLTLVFRALTDPIAEVRRPVEKLFEWAAPKKLAAYGLSDFDAGDAVRTVFASEIPALLSVAHGGCEYAPMVIEAISKSLIGPIDKNGNPTSTAVQLSLSSLTALDRQDWVRALSAGSRMRAPSWR